LIEAFCVITQQQIAKTSEEYTDRIICIITLFETNSPKSFIFDVTSYITSFINEFNHRISFLQLLQKSNTVERQSKMGRADPDEGCKSMLSVKCC
jgi:hypothetical protein